MPGMNEREAAVLYYPNKMGRIILLAMEEILGRTEVSTVLNLAGLPEYIDHPPAANQELHVPFGHISRIQSAFEQAYGVRSGHGLALRTGRACFKYSLRGFGPELGLTDLSFRLLPLAQKIKTGTEVLAAFFNDFTDQRVHIERNGKNLFWHIDRCPYCAGRHGSQPCCHLAVGLLQEALFWLSGGKYYRVEETGCIAHGDSACTISIDKEPMS